MIKIKILNQDVAFTTVTQTCLCFLPTLAHLESSLVKNQRQSMWNNNACEFCKVFLMLLDKNKCQQVSYFMILLHQWWKKAKKKKKKKNYINTAFSSTASTPVIKFTTHFIGLDKEQMVTVNTFFFFNKIHIHILL